MDPKRKYRGIDREVDMRVFNHLHDSQLYRNALDQYSEYLACEEEYTADNLSLMASFVEMLNGFHVECEIVIYSMDPIKDMEKLCFLGIDILDQHMKSVVKESPRQRFQRVNQFGLFFSEEDASNAIQQMNMIDANCNDLFFVYRYSMH